MPHAMADTPVSLPLYRALPAEDALGALWLVAAHRTDRLCSSRADQPTLLSVGCLRTFLPVACLRWLVRLDERIPQPHGRNRPSAHSRSLWGVSGRPLYVFPLGLREGRLSVVAGILGTGTGTTISPSMPAKSFGLHVYKGNPFARAVAAIMTS